MDDDRTRDLNTLTFDLSPGPHTRVGLLIDGKSFLEEWDLGRRFVPLSYDELAGPILALDDIYLQSEAVSIESLFLGSCSCGYTGCSAVFCDVRIEHGEMVWQNFGTNQPSSLPHVGPFRFDWDEVVTDLREKRNAHRDTLA